MRTIIILVTLSLGALGGVLGWSTVAHAEETPVNVPLAYVPNLSNWGPTTAIGTASVWSKDAEVRLKVQGLPVLTTQVYAVWLVDPRAGHFLAVGRFNVGTDGTAQLDVSLPGSLPQGYTMVLITVQPDPEANHATPSTLYSIAGSFQGNSAVQQQIKQLPNTGSAGQPTAAPRPPGIAVPNLPGLVTLVVGILSIFIVWRRNRRPRPLA